MSDHWSSARIFSLGFSILSFSFCLFLVNFFLFAPSRLKCNKWTCLHLFFNALAECWGTKGQTIWSCQESSKWKKHIFFLIGGIFEVVLMMVTDGSFVSLNTFEFRQRRRVRLTQNRTSLATDQRLTGTLGYNEPTKLTAASILFSFSFFNFLL